MTKLIYICLCCLFGPALVSAQGIEFRKGTWSEIKEIAKAENKLIFFDAKTSWCGPCKWMAKNTFPNEIVGEFYEDNFISYALDMEKGEGVELAKEFKIAAYPTLLFLNSNGAIVHRTSGALDAERFLALGKVAIDPRRNLAGMEQRYIDGERSKEFIREYLLRLAESGNPRKEIVDWYFYGQSNDDLLTKENFGVINIHINDINHPQFRFLEQNKEAYAKIVTPKDVGDKIYNTYRSNLLGAIYSGDSLKWEITRSAVKASAVEDPEKLLAYSDMYYASQKKNWGVYVNAVDHYVTTYEFDNWELLNMYAWKIYKNESMSDMTAIDMALSWVDRSIELKDCYANNDTRAALLFKRGDKKGALEAANRALSKATPDEDTSETEKLISQISN